MDFLTVFPFDGVFFLVFRFGKVPRGRLLRFIEACLHMLRMLRLARIPRHLSYWKNDLQLSYGFRTTVYSAGLLVVMAQVMAALFTVAGLIDIGSNNSWIEKYYGQEFDAPQDLQFRDTYLLAIYWAIYTLTGIGYGDVTPTAHNRLEFLVVLFCMVMGSLTWALIVANILSLIQDSNAKTAEQAQRMDMVNSIITSHNLDRGLALRCREYFSKLGDLTQASESRKVIAMMSPMLASEVTRTVYNDWIEDVWWLRNVTNSCVVQLVLRMENTLYIPKEYIPDQRAVCFVMRGLAIWGGHLMRKGDSWGMDVILDAGNLRKAHTGMALTFVETICLRRHQLDMVLAEHPDDKAKIRRAKVTLATIRGLVNKAKELAAREGMAFGNSNRRQFLGGSMFTAQPVGTIGQRPGEDVVLEETSMETRLILNRLNDIEDNIATCDNRIDELAYCVQVGCQNYRQALDMIHNFVNPPMDAAAEAAKDMLTM
eukprot:CAMPEP_0204328384 /NCGR_PEP_ID=MMETSP0469-20131031/13317_1 /ASSEMBLY_ACC=CAM_ASM_000384 /TAXON_ID=2969 /ORGANISM="Oxyrrhis marina" /LENGTH=483 /DNA_ID=CAMNT_0051310769 /DNA_START=91 /DNA_END=1542 /DNA_ORIENTATION=+